MDNYKNNKRKFSEPKEIPSKKRRDSNKGAENNIFNIITCDIWKIIFQFIYISVNCDDNSNVFKNIRFTCKLFRQLSLPYWNQELPEDNLEAYFAQENTLEYVHKITVDGTFINLKRKESEFYWEDFNKASKIGFLPIIKKMVKDGADVNQVNTVNCQTPLLYACKYENLELVQFLVQNGADVNQFNPANQQTPILYACKIGNLELVRFLVQNGADVNEKDNSEWTSLLNECQIGYLEKINNGTNPLKNACRIGNLELVQFLIQNGAN